MTNRNSWPAFTLVEVFVCIWFLLVGTFVVSAMVGFVWFLYYVLTSPAVNKFLGY